MIIYTPNGVEYWFNKKLRARAPYANSKIITLVNTAAKSNQSGIEKPQTIAEEFLGKSAFMKMATDKNSRVNAYVQRIQMKNDKNFNY